MHLRSTVACIICRAVAKSRHIRDKSELMSLLDLINEELDASTTLVRSSLRVVVAANDGEYEWLVRLENSNPIILRWDDLSNNIRRLIVVLHQLPATYAASLLARPHTTNWLAQWEEFITSLLPIEHRRRMTQCMIGSVFFGEYAPQFPIHICGPHGANKH